MALKLQEIEGALMPKISEKPKRSDGKVYKKWQEELEAGYEKLNDVGVEIVKEYFKSNPIKVCGSAPWGTLPPDKNPFRSEWETLSKKLLTTDTLKDKDNLKQLKNAIYTGSQEVWLEEEVKNDKQLKKCVSELSYEMRSRLTLLKNGDQKREFLVGFFGHKGRKKTLPAFIRALNLNYWSHKKCKPLLLEITSLEAQVKELKKQQPIAEPEKEISLPDKPSLSSVINMVRHGRIRDFVEKEAYVKYMSNPQHFKKLTPAQREELMSEVNGWKEFAEYAPKALPVLDMFYYILKASANL